jgi:hypothetical protein
LNMPHCGHLRGSMLDCTLSGVEGPYRRLWAPMVAI